MDYKILSYQKEYEFLKSRFLDGYNCLSFDDGGFPCLVKNYGSSSRIFYNFHSFIDCLINEYGYSYFKYCN